MTDDRLVSRRNVLRSGGIVGGGLVAGRVVSGRTSTSEKGQGQGGVGYISVSSYEKIVGDQEVDCATGEDGWGDSFYIRREARNAQDEAGVSIEVPSSCNGNGPAKTFRGYLITAKSDTECAGGPNGTGPWLEDCCSWVFVNENRDIRFDIEQRITEVHGPEPPEPCHDDAQPVDDQGDPVGGDFGVVRVTFAPDPERGNALKQELDEVRSATEKYTDPDTADDDNYWQLPEPQDPGDPTTSISPDELVDQGRSYCDRGFHQLSVSRIPSTELTEPSGLVYGVDGDGNLMLGAVKWIVPQLDEFENTPPDIFEHDDGAEIWEEDEIFENGWSLYAWVHAKNPNGVFARDNPREEFSPDGCTEL